MLSKKKSKIFQKSISGAQAQGPIKVQYCDLKKKIHSKISDLEAGNWDGGG